MHLPKRSTLLAWSVFMSLGLGTQALAVELDRQRVGQDLPHPGHESTLVT
jgi:hypothetical protein